MADDKKQQAEQPKKPAKPSEAALAAMTPSQAALAVVGEFEGEPGSAEALAHGERYQAEKRKRRFG